MQTYKARDGWRWRLRAKNGAKVAVSGEAFASKRNAARAAWAVIELLRGIVAVEEKHG